MGVADVGRDERELGLLEDLAKVVRPEVELVVAQGVDVDDVGHGVQCIDHVDAVGLEQAREHRGGDVVAVHEVERVARVRVLELFDEGEVAGEVGQSFLAGLFVTEAAMEV